MMNRIRNDYLPLLLLLLNLLLWIALPAHAEAPPLVTAVESVGMTVSDMDRAVAFYTDVLSFTKLSDVEVAGGDYERLEGVFGLRMRIVRLKLGDEVLELTQYLAPEGRPIPSDVRSNDRAFQHVAIIVSDMGRAYQWLRDHRVRYASSGPQRLPDWNPNAGGIEAFYFKDPDGHTLEILHFPKEKGKAKWHVAGTDRLFLGIDHTAIVIGDTDQSLRFYRDTLGLTVAGNSENYGVEQEHLNNVFGARLRITSLHAAEGPSIEFLEYLTPRDGRPASPDTHANDIIHWQTRLVTRDAGVAEKRLFAGYRLVSPGTVMLPDDQLGFHAGLLVRDPDGHSMEVVQK